MATFEWRDYVFPVFGGEPAADGGTLADPILYGTAFNLGNGLFMTAGHSIENALSNKHSMIMVGWYGYIEATFFEITDYEVITDFDIALFKAKDLGKCISERGLPWDFSELPLLEDVQTAGFPHGLDLEERVLRMRAQKGYVVAATQHKTIFPRGLYCYELSFSCDRGLSGAPLFRNVYPLVLSGVIITNIETHIDIHKMTEKNIEEGTEIIYERTETTPLGLAITTHSLRDLESRILGDTMGVYLERYKLVK